MKIRELYSNKLKWTQKVAGRDSEGNPTTTNERLLKEAVCFCLLGALNYCYGIGTEGYLVAKAKIAQRLMTPKDKKKWPESVIAHWNDDPKRKFQEVKALVEELDV